MGSMASQFEVPGLSGIMSYVSALQTKEDMEAQAKASEYQAEYTEKAAEVEVQDFMEVVNQAVGTATAVTGASGFDASSESSQDAVDAIVRRGEIDSAYIKMKGTIESNALRDQAEQLRVTAKNQLRINRVAAGSEAFTNSGGGVANYASQYTGGGGSVNPQGNQQSGGMDIATSDMWANETTVQSFGGEISSYEGMVFY